MTIDLIKFASIGGEVSENYWGRSDLAKFDLSLAIAENWYVDYHGGLSTSPGTEFIDFVMNDEFDTKFFSFRFSSNIANTNVLLFGKDYIRFIQDGAYVLENEKPIASVTQANPGVMAVIAHGWTTDDWIKFPSVGEMTQLANRTVRVVVLTVDTVELRDVFNNPIDTSAYTAYGSGGTAARIYTLVSPYAVADLDRLRSSQIRDTMRFTHNNYPIYNLIRNDSADWTLEEEDLTNSLERPVISSVTSLGTSESIGIGYVVTQVNAEGVESLPSDYGFAVDMSTQDLSAVIKWTPLDGADYYNIYKTRSTVENTSDLISRGFQVGYCGQAEGAHFLDRNITPDFAKTPPQGNNPFANGAILGINIAAGGSGYTNASVITVTDPSPDAAGFIGYVIVSTSPADNTGPVTGIIILDGGAGYTNPTFTITVGSGASVSAVLSEASGNNPAVSTVFQQRQVYGATLNQPLTLFGARPGRLSDMTVSIITLANDAYEHDVDSDDASPFQHIMPARGGLLVFTVAGIWLVAGSNGAAITATDVQAEPQSSSGASPVPPIRVNNDILYCEANGGKVMQLTYNDVIKLYAGVDLSLLANHLISANKQITAMAYAADPDKLIWARRQDGVMLNFTIIKEQEVFAWTRRLTKGAFEDVISLDENNTSIVYTIVTRDINGRRTKFLEKIARTDWETIEDAFCVDCGLKLTPTFPAAAMQLAATTGTGIQLRAFAGIFAASDVGKIVRYGTGKATVASYINSSIVMVDFITDVTDVVPFTDPVLPRRAQEGEWTLDAEVMTVTGLDHLEGETVSVLYDGNVLTGEVITNGSLTLPAAASRVIVGIPYTCTAKNLPLTVEGNVIEDKVKRIVGTALRVKDTRGLKVGTSLDKLYEVKERSWESYGQSTAAQSGIKHVLVEPIWEEDATQYLVQDNPLPATVLGYVLNIEVGDDPN